MTSRLIALVGLLLLVAGSALGGGKQPVYLISLHEEGDQMEGPRKIQEFEVRGEMRYFRKMPVLTQRNFKAYWAFPAEDGRTWGAVFWLDTSGQHALRRLGVANRGQYLATAVNRQPADVLMIDRVPEDGRIVVWKNLSPELFAVIDKEKKIRRIGDPATPAALARRGSAAAASGVSGVSGGRAFLPDGSPLPDGAVVGRIDPATLNDAALVGPAPGARRAASKPSKPRAGDEPFGPDDTLERPDLRPVPEPAPSRN
jgi:hypothetical protein